MTETVQIAGREKSYTIHIHIGNVTDIVMIYLTMPQKMDELSALYQHTWEQSNERDYAMISVEIANWNDELSPWEFQEANGRLSFAGRGGALLLDLEQYIIPGICQKFDIEQEQSRFVIAGYSLAGLFAVWAMYQTKRFEGAVSCSGSLWYPEFLQYALEHKLQKNCVMYLSLGDKEEKTRNPYMARVGEVTRALYQQYQQDYRIKCVALEWNAGNHFHQVEERIITGMAWMLRAIDCE